MISMVLLVTTAISSISWLSYRVALKAIIRYMKDKGYMPPSAKETKTYCTCAVKDLFHIR